MNPMIRAMKNLVFRQHESYDKWLLKVKSTFIFQMWTLSIVILWVMVLWSIGSGYQHSRGTYYLHFQDRIGMV
jgi:fumarate reductase subunit C